MNFIRKGKGSSKVHYSTNSIELANGIKSLLLRFSIFCSIQIAQKDDYKPAYNISITGKNNIIKFAEKVGIFGSKMKILNELKNSLTKSIGNPNSDVISKDVWQNIKRIKKEKDFTERSFQAALGTNYCGSTLYKSNLSRQRLNKVATILKEKDLKNLSNSDIKWEKIKSIEHIGNEMTYDIHVEDTHNFVADNFIVHNSGAIEQDADMVIFLYRPEYYGFDQDDDGNPTAGIGEVIIAKHRNGALDTVKVRWVGQFAKFKDLDFMDGGQIEGFVPLNQIITKESKMNDNGPQPGYPGPPDDDIPF